MNDWEHVDKEEIIISEDGLDEAIHNAYLKGKQDVLDKIRTEIEQEYNKYRNMSEKWDERACGIGTTLEIIDKYRGEET